MMKIISWDSDHCSNRKSNNSIAFGRLFRPFKSALALTKGNPVDSTPFVQAVIPIPATNPLYHKYQIFLFQLALVIQIHSHTNSVHSTWICRITYRINYLQIFWQLANFMVHATAEYRGLIWKRIRYTPWKRFKIIARVSANSAFEKNYFRLKFNLYMFPST